jgi:hypothetical protein
MISRYWTRTADRCQRSLLGTRFMPRMMWLGLAFFTAAFSSSFHLGSQTVRLAQCPPPGDTLSLLQPGDSAFSDAKAVTSFLNRRGFTVRCVTRSVMFGTAGVGNVAGFQTDRGTVTVFFVPVSESFHASSIRTDHGYRITYSKAGQHPAHVVVRSDGPEYFFQHSGWIFNVFTPQLAEALRKALQG